MMNLGVNINETAALRSQATTEVGNRYPVQASKVYGTRNNLYLTRKKMKTILRVFTP
jgi:hypothetical protein